MLQGESNLFARVADGDESAFTTIFSHYVPRIQSFLFKMVKSKEAAEEIVHDVFLSLWINREKLPAIENYQAYIFTAATNKTYTYLKSAVGKKKVFSIYKKR